MVAERGVWLHQEQIPEKICEQMVDVHVPQDVGQVLEVPKIQSRDRILQCTGEQILDVPALEKAEQLAEVPKIVPQDRIQQRTVEHTVDILVPQDVEERAEFFKASSQDRVQLRFGGQIVETLAISLAEKIVEVPVIQTEEKTQQGVNMCVQHVVNAVEVEKSNIIEETVQRMKPIIQEKVNQETKCIEVPPLQFMDKAVDIPVVAQRKAHMNQMVQKIIEFLQLQYTDDVVGVPVVSVVRAPLVRAVMKTVETLRVQIVAETTEIPQLPLVDEIVTIPEIQMIQGPQTSESLSVDSRELSHQDCEVLCHVNKQSPDTACRVHVDRNDLHAGNGARTAGAAQHRSTQQQDNQAQTARQ